jgi:hypothetical protein
MTIDDHIALLRASIHRDTGRNFVSLEGGSAQVHAVEALIAEVERLRKTMATIGGMTRATQPREILALLRSEGIEA